MFWLLLKIVSYLLCLLVCLVVGRELISLYYLYYYKKQGVKVEYYPMIGAIVNSLPKGSNPDHCVRFRELFERHRKEPIVAMNFFFKEGVVFLLSDEVQKEFFLKEIDNTVKYCEAEGLNVGFFFENGEHVFRMRGYYGKFFNFDNIRKISKDVTSIVQNYLQEYKRLHFLKGSESIRVNIKEFLLPILSSIVQKVLMGVDPAEVPKLNGKDICEVSIEYLAMVFDNTIKKPLNTLLSEIPAVYNRLPDIKALKAKRREIDEFAFEQFTKRKSEGPKSDPNILDLMVEVSRDSASEGKPEMTAFEVGGECLLFQLAGSDTSMEVSTTALLILAENQAVQERLRSMADKAMGKPKGAIEFDDYNSDETLDDYINEFLRLGSAFGVLGSRKAIKDFKVGGVTIKKGTTITIPGSLLTTTTRFWENGAQFDGERLNKKNRANIKMAGNLPFGNGRRICIGKALGELIVRNILLNVVKEFKVSKAEGASEERSLAGFYSWKAPEMVLRSRDHSK